MIKFPYTYYNENSSTINTKFHYNCHRFLCQAFYKKKLCETFYSYYSNFTEKKKKQDTKIIQCNN